MRQKIQKCIENDLPILIYGRSGWGKTSIVDQIGADLGLDVVKLSLCLCLPEDIGGIPSPNGESFRYLLPEWFQSRRDREFILFLDEINQASPQTLHAIYSLVQERRLHGVTNKGMKIVAAGNLDDENPHLTEIMQPLLNRFYILDFIHDMEQAVAYLNHKYNINLKEISHSPRDTEQGIIAFKAGLEDLAVKKAGLSVVKVLRNDHAFTDIDDMIMDVRQGEIKDRNGFL